MSIYYNFACYDLAKNKIIIKVHSGSNAEAYASNDTYNKSLIFEKKLEEEGYTKIDLL